MRTGARARRAAFAATLALAAGGLAGCDQIEAETTTVTRTVTTGATGGDGATGGVRAPDGPRGTIGIRIFGPLQLGMTQDRVREEVGEPDREREVNFGTGAAPQTNWIWDVEGGTVTLKFDNSNGTLAGWSTDSPRFESAPGVAVGDSIKPVLEEFSDQLVEDPLGTGALVLSEGAPGSSPALTFALEENGNEIVQISGGAVVQPAGD
jgi:hypothetical protein